jgi:dTMP kinase
VTQPRKSVRGVFITFEGGDGSGKSTQSRRLAKRLQAEGRQVLLLREPGGTKLGEKVRKVLLERKHPIQPEAELLLFLAARAELVRDVIRPALARGEVVLCDRFSDSTLAYQGYGRGLDIESLTQLDVWATGGLVPDLTVLLDVPVEVGRAHVGKDADAIEREDNAFHERVRRGFLTIAAEAPDRFLVLDATRNKADVSADVWRRIVTLT